MSSSSGVDQSCSYYSSQPRGFLTPPPTWKTSRCSPMMPGSEKKPRRSPQAKTDLFHVIHKVPTGDSPYVRAKHVQLIDRDPSRAIALFWTAINSGDRVDSALKDMAVVMKQLDRLDEAIEAIKSFRHLCPSEAQESLDNILVELYKKSGRIEEEIEMLQLKLKQIEQGIAFGGKRTKMARSQGKKIQVTVEKEYFRLLGNLAWAYMQKKDFKSAEEHYRKALSLESDKNKQCNLAMCLIHLNKLSEAKFLLQAIRVSSDNGRMAESHAKSFERASQMLAELETQCVLKPANEVEHNNKSGMAGRSAEGHFKGVVPFGACDNGLQSFRLSSSVNKMKKGSFTEFQCEKRADFDRRRNNYLFNNCQAEVGPEHNRAYESPSCNGRIPKVLFTQPRRSSWSLNTGDKKNGGLADKARGGFCQKLSFEQPTDSENVRSVVNQKLGYYSTASATLMPKVSEKHLPRSSGDWRKSTSDNLDRVNNETKQPLKDNVERTAHSLAYDGQKMTTKEEYGSDDCRKAKVIISDRNCCQSCAFDSEGSMGPLDAVNVENPKSIKELQTAYKISACKCTKSWADMVEDDDQQLDSMRSDFPQNYSGNTLLVTYPTPGRDSAGSMDTEGYNDENVDSNMISENAASLNQAEKLMQKIESVDLGCGGYFTQPEKITISMSQPVRRSLCFDQDQKPGTEKSCASPLPMKALDFDGPGLVLSEDFTCTKSTKPRHRLQVFQDITCVGSPRP